MTDKHKHLREISERQREKEEQEREIQAVALKVVLYLKASGRVKQLSAELAEARTEAERLRNEILPAVDELSK